MWEILALPFIIAFYIIAYFISTGFMVWLMLLHLCCHLIHLAVRWDTAKYRNSMDYWP